MTTDHPELATTEVEDARVSTRRHEVRRDRPRPRQPGPHPRRPRVHRGRRRAGAELRPHHPALLGGGRRHREGGPRRQGRGAGRHRLQERGRHPAPRAVDPQERASPRTRSPSARWIDALVMQKEDQDGRLILSKKRARFEKAWKRIEAAAAAGETRRGHGHRGRQGRPDPRPRRARVPARLAGRHPPRPGPRRVPRPQARVQGHRAQPEPQQRRALAPGGARGRAARGAPEDPRRAPAGPGGGGRDLEHRRVRRLRGPRRHRRPDPHLRALVEPRQPPVRGAHDRREGARSRCSTSTATASASPWA